MAHNNSSSAGGIFVTIIIIGILIWGVHHIFKPDSWLGTYEVPSSFYVGTQKFSSKYDCANWLELMKTNPSPRDAYHFECGSNCKPPTTVPGLYICDETFE